VNAALLSAGRWFKGAHRRTSVRLVAAALAIVIAVFAVLLAHDIRSWRNTMREDAMRYTISPTAPVVFEPPTYLPADVSARLLAADRDRRMLSALRFFAAANSLDTSNGVMPNDEQLLQTTEKSLTLAAQNPDQNAAAEADSLLAVILLKDSRAGFVQDLAPYAAAITAMQSAVRAAPYDEHATANLELLLRQFRADSRGPTEQQANNQGSKPRGKAVGRGTGIPPVSSPTGDY